MCVRVSGGRCHKQMDGKTRAQTRVKETDIWLGCFSNIMVVAFVVWVGLGGQRSDVRMRFRRRRNIRESTRKENIVFEENSVKTMFDRSREWRKTPPTR